MSRLTHCITKMGKMLSKAEVQQLKESHAAYLDGGLDANAAATKTAEDFLTDAHTKVLGYENEIKIKGGDVKTDGFDLAEQLNLDRVVDKVEKSPDAPAAEIFNSASETTSYVLEKLNSVTNDLKAWDPDLNPDGTVKADKTIDSKVEAALTEIKAQAETGELDLTEKQIVDLETAAQESDITPLALNVLARKKSGDIEDAGTGHHIRKIYKLQYPSNNKARDAMWGLKQFPAIRLGSAVMVFMPDKSYRANIASNLVRWGGNYSNRSEITAFDAKVLKEKYEASLKGQPATEENFTDKPEDITPAGLRTFGKKQGGFIDFSIFNRPSEQEEVGDRVPLNEEEAAAVDKIFGEKQAPIKKVKDSLNDVVVDAKTKLRQYTVDQFASFKEILKDDRSWMLANLTASANGVIESSINHGQPFLDSEGVVGMDMNKPSLVKVLEPLGENLDRFTYYMAGNRAEKLMAEGRENLFTEDQIKVMKGMNRGNEALFELVRKNFESLNDSFVQIGVDTGLINAEEAAVWREEGFYMPFYRVLSDDKSSRGPRAMGNAGLVRQQAYKKLKGSDRKLDNLLTNAVLNWNHLLSASLKNQAGVAAIEQAVKMGAAEKVSKEAASKNAIFLRRDGAEVWYEVSEPLVLDSLNSLNWEGLNGTTMKVLRTFKRALTIGVTASPEFKIANLIRDSIQAAATTTASVNVPKNLVEGWRATKEDSLTNVAMLTGGATFGQSGYIHGSDPIALERMIEKGVKPSSILDTPAKYLNVFKMYQDFGARLENINRAAEYVQTLARGEGTLKATFNARDQLDFTRTGSATWVRALSQMVPFLNARLQGLDKLARSAPGSISELLDPKQFSQFKAVIGAYSLASIGMYLAIKDDDDYKQLEEWEKRTYHHFRIPGVDVLFRIPRPFEVGALAYMAESMAQQAVDDEVHGELFAERMMNTLLDTFSFNPIPQAIKPALEIGFNKNFFTGRPIEPPYASISDLSPERIKRIWTSETAVWASEKVNDITWGKVAVSPIQMEHIVRGYFSWAGATTLAGIDMLVTRPLTNAPVRPATKLSEYPLIKRFATSLPVSNSKYTGDFYDRLSEINNAYSDIQDAKKLGEEEEYRRLLVEKGDLLKLRNFYTAQQKKMSKISQRRKLIQMSNMSAKEKRDQLDRLTIIQNNLTRQIAEKTEAFDEARKAAKSK